MDNWWENDPVVSQETSNDNWWENDPTVNDWGLTQEENQPRVDPTNVDLSAAQSPFEPNKTVRSGSDIYGDIENDPKYGQLKDYESNPLSRIGIDTPWGEYSLRGRTPDNIVDLKKQREAEMMDVYNRTGYEDTLKVPVPFSEKQIDTGIKYRAQEQLTNNPNYDPNDPTSDPMVSKTFSVESPRQVEMPDWVNTMSRISYQAAQSIVTGTLDFVTEGNLTGEGQFGKAAPDMVADNWIEDFAGEIATYAIGPGIIDKTLEKVGKGIKGVSRTAKVGELASQVLSKMSGEDLAIIKQTYENVLKRTGNAAQAYKASNTKAKMIISGMGFGLKEAIVSPGTSEGLIDPNTLKDTVSPYADLSEEQARNLSFALDQPIIGGTLGLLGRMVQKGYDNVAKPALGGLRNVTLANINAGNLMSNTPILKSAVGINEKDAGLRFAMWLDPNLFSSTVSEAQFRLGVLGSSLQNNAVKNIQAAGVEKSINLDTPSAFLQASKDYYRVAYANLKDELGPEEFNKWIEEKATESANKLYELRTAVMGDSKVLSQTSKGAGQIMDFFDEVSDALTNSSMINSQNLAGQRMSTYVKDKIEPLKTQEDIAFREFQSAELTSKNAITESPIYKELLNSVDLVDNLGSKEAERKIIDTIGEKTYQALKTKKQEYQTLYEEIAKSGADADPSSLLQIIKEGNKTDPVLMKIAESINSDSSFDNIYNKVRNNISKEIGAALKSGNSDRLETLYQLKNNINEYQMDWLKSNGDADVANLAEQAKGKYIEYITTFKDNDKMRLLTKAGEQRLRGENMPQGLGPGQGVTDYQVNISNLIEQNLGGNAGTKYLESLKRATAAGAQPIDKELSRYYASKAMTSIVDKIVRGTTQDVKALRQSVSEYADKIRQVDPELADKFSRLQSDIEAADNLYKNKEVAFNAIKETVEKVETEYKDSVLKEFLYKNYEPIDDTGGIMKRIFNQPEAGNKIDELYKLADSTSDGEVIKEAIQSTYVNYMRDKVVSRSQLGQYVLTEEGIPKTAFKINERQLENFFDSDTKNIALMTKIFQTNPEVVEQLRQAATTYLKLTKTTPKARDELLKSGLIPKDLNPKDAMSTLIYIVAGPLSREGTIARRLTGPISVRSFEQVMNANQQTMVLALSDPRGFSELLGKIKDGISVEEARREFIEKWYRAASRATYSGENVTVDMNNLK